MPYKVQFLGLVCFYRDGNDRQALLPDGRDPGPGIDPHYASILVEPDAVDSGGTSGWPVNADTERGIYELPPCSISIETADVPGTLDTSAHDGVLPQLRQIDPNFEIDPDRAQTIARLSIRQGALSARCVPGGEALMSQLVVPHEGPITVTVTPIDSSPTRTLRLAPETEILIGNMAKHGVYADNPQVDGHFRIYEKLTFRTVSLTEPSTIEGAPPPDTDHWYFRIAQPINLSVSCTNTGCCGG